MTNETQTLMLGDIDIGSYVKEPAPILTSQEKDKIYKIKNKIDELKQDNLSFEKFLTERLENELKVLEKKFLESELNISGYPEIDLSFLSKSYDKEVLVENTIIKEATFCENRKIGPGKINIEVPAFSIYPFYGGNEFEIRYTLSQECSATGRDRHNLNIIFSLLFFRKNSEDIKNMESLSKNLIKSMIGNFIFSSEYGRLGYVSNDLAKKYLPKKFETLIKDNYNLLNLILTSQFNGIIPEQTKQKVKESEEYFKKEDIYLVSETKPEEWNVQENINYDPLVIGITNEKAYLIDHFDCTPLENLVKDIYIKEKLN